MTRYVRLQAYLILELSLILPQASHAMTSEDSEVTESVYEDRRYESTSAWRTFFIVMTDFHDQYIVIFMTYTNISIASSFLVFSKLR